MSRQEKKIQVQTAADPGIAPPEPFTLDSSRPISRYFKSH